MRLTRRTILALLPLAGCGQPPTVEPVTMPRSGEPAGAGDPTRAALISARSAFADQRSLVGHPAAAARALGQLEFLAAELNTGGRWIGVQPIVPITLQQARAEARAALGFRIDAPAQLAVDSLYGAAEALDGGNGAAAAAALAPFVANGDGAAAVGRLANLPPLPRAQQATAIAYNEMWQRERQREVR